MLADACAARFANGGAFVAIGRSITQFKPTNHKIEVVSAQPITRAAGDPGTSKGLSHTWLALRHRNFRLFFGGQSVSLIGTWMTRVAMLWLVYRLTGSALLLGTVGFVGQIPALFLAPLAGVVVDRMDRRKVMIVTQILAMLQSLALAVLTLARVINIYEVMALAFLQGCTTAFDTPARQALMVRLVETREELSNAIALNAAMTDSTRLIGPSIAGLLIAATNEGVCFLIDGISFIAVIVSLFRMRIKPVESAPARDDMMTQLREGWTYVTGSLPLRNILLLFALVSLMGWPFMALMPVFAAQVLHGGPHTMGFLTGAVGFGAFLAAISMVLRRTVRGLEIWLPRSAILFGIGLICFGFSHWQWSSLLFMVVTGFGMIKGLVSSNTIMQTLTDDRMRGRVMSYYTLAMLGMAPFGNLLTGVVANAIGAPRTVMISGALCIAGGLWFFSQLGKIRADMRPIYQRHGILPAADAAQELGTEI
jgi:MFS family permease